MAQEGELAERCTGAEGGDALLWQGNLAAALNSFRDGLAISERLVKSDPSNAEGQRYLSVSYDKVGSVLMAQGNLAAALASYRDGLAIRERLAKSDANNAGWQRDLSVSYDNIGDLLEQLEGPDGGRASAVLREGNGTDVAL